MQNFEFISASSIDHIVSILASDGNQVRLLNGGTDLLVQLREGRRTARLVVDIKNVPELKELKVTSNGIWLGSAVTCLRFCSNPQVARDYPGMVDAVSLIGGTQIQGRATIGGNLCNASPAADTIPALIVHQAVCEIAGPSGKRDLLVDDFCTGPGENALEAGEFLVGLRIPAPTAGFGARYLRFIPRNEMDIAVVGAGAAVTLSPDGSTFLEARLALGAVAPIPLFVEGVSQSLVGQAVSPEVLNKAALLAQDAAQPISDMRGTVDHRRLLSTVLSRRALEGAIERARLTLQVLA